MKKFKSGFTLAEVLITLSIIGIIAAIVMPALISSYQYRTVGVKLSKFLSTTEDAARAYVVSNDILNADIDANGKYSGLDNFINDTYMINRIFTTGGEFKKKNGTLKETPDGGVRNTYEIAKGGSDILAFTKYAEDLDAIDFEYAVLKDGTSVAFYALPGVEDDVWETGNHENIPNQAQIGVPALGIIFNPNATGLPSTVRQRFAFVVTELGFVLPSPEDECLWDIYEANWSTKSDMFASGKACGRDKIKEE